VAAALALALGGGALLRARLAPWVALRPAAEPGTSFEGAALRLREEQAAGRLALDLATDSPAEARRFVRDRAGLSAPLVESRPAKDGASFELEGVKLVEVGGAGAVAVAYRIDGRPALLLTAAAGDVEGGPAHWSPLRARKEVRFRFRDGHKLLTWTNSGQTYVLVSDQPRYGERSCYLCHDSAERRALIDALGS